MYFRLQIKGWPWEPEADLGIVFMDCSPGPPKLTVHPSLFETCLKEIKISEAHGYL